MDYGKAIEALEQGKMIAREGWNGKGMFVYKTIPSSVAIQFIPNMSSLPKDVKDEFAKRGKEISFGSGMNIVKQDNTVDSWVASSADTFAKDWLIL